MDLVRAYFSHSYRRADRDVNLFFWKLCLEEGFSLVVDPKAETLSITRLEKLIQRTAATVVVVPLRAEEQRLRCSPYAVLEYGLAVQAQAPTLAFVETSVAGRYFSSRTHAVVPFSRARLDESTTEARAALKALKAVASARRRSLTGPLGTIALLRSRNARRLYSDKVVDAMRDVVSRLGFDFAVDELDSELPHMLALRLDDYEAVIVDVHSDSADRWVLPYVYARFVPSIRLFHLKGSGAVPTEGDFLDILASQVKLERSGTDQIVLFWRELPELLSKLESQLLRLRQPHTELAPEADGERYLRSLGRSPSEGQVFISNADDTNDFAMELSRELYLSNIQHFHYRSANDIPVGSEWPQQLDERVRRSDVFLALVSKGYTESEWCMRELEVARQNVGTDIVPYFLDRGVTLDGLSRQGRLLSPQSGNAVGQIVKDVDEILDNRSPKVSGMGTAVKGKVRFEPPIDVLILTIKSEEYVAVLKSLDDHAPVEPTKDRPNLYSWEYGIIRRASSDAAPYRIVVGLIGHQGQLPASDATKESARTWIPRLCLIVGIGGGLPQRKVQLGDVLVSTEVWHYEFGTAGENFDPSIRHLFQVNDPLLSAALTLDANHSDWADKIASERPTPGAPKVHSGVIASGDKVIERADSPLFAPVLAKEKKIIGVEMEGGGAASALLRLQQQQVGTDGSSIGFLMIRGVSDLVRSEEMDPQTGDQRSERKRWTDYASLVAGQFSAELIRRRWPFAPR